MQNLKFETVTTQKTVQRTPMTDIEYLAWWAEHSDQQRCADLSTAGVDMQNERQGYLVLYQGGTEQEYYSWSPKEIMDDAVMSPLIKIDLDALAADPAFQDTVARVRSRLIAAQRDLSKAREATFVLPENCNDPSELIRALVVSLSAMPRTIEIDLDREVPAGLIEKMSDALYDGVCERFGCDKTMPAEPAQVASPKITDTAEPNFSPLFEKAHTEFLRQLSVTSLPRALEAALVVYTDGLTYTEE